MAQDDPVQQEAVEEVVEGEPGTELTPEEQSEADKFDLDAELVQAVQNARRSSVAILSSLSKTLYDVIPLGPWAVIRKHLRGETQAGGVTILAQERSSVGEVVATNGVLPVKPGDLVLFSNFAMEVKDCEELTGEKELFLVREEELYARLQPKETA